VLRGAVAPEKLPPPAAAPCDCRKSVCHCLVRLGDLARRGAALPIACLDVGGVLCTSDLTVKGVADLPSKRELQALLTAQVCDNGR